MAEELSDDLKQLGHCLGFAAGGGATKILLQAAERRDRNVHHRGGQLAAVTRQWDAEQHQIQASLRSRRQTPRHCRAISQLARGKSCGDRNKLIAEMLQVWIKAVWGLSLGNVLRLVIMFSVFSTTQ